MSPQLGPRQIDTLLKHLLAARRQLAVEPEVRRSSERSLLKAELLASGGNISRAARRLGIARSTLRYRLKIHGLEQLVAQD